MAMHLITSKYQLANDTVIKETVYSGQHLFRGTKVNHNLLISRVNKMNYISLRPKGDLKNVHILLFSDCIIMMQLWRLQLYMQNLHNKGIFLILVNSITNLGHSAILRNILRYVCSVS